ncbi:MAG: Uma2 family endonuclease [Aliidongia sp.]
MIGKVHQVAAMNVALRKPMTTAEFLEWERRQSLRYEFDGFQTIAMTGGTAAHAAIHRNLAVAITSRLRGRPGQFFGSDLKIELAGKIRYPDRSRDEESRICRRTVGPTLRDPVTG